MAQCVLLADNADFLQQTPRFVRDTSQLWHRPNISRDEGNFYVSTVTLAFILILLSFFVLEYYCSVDCMSCVVKFCVQLFSCSRTNRRDLLLSETVLRFRDPSVLLSE